MTPRAAAPATGRRSLLRDRTRVGRRSRPAVPGTGGCRRGQRTPHRLVAQPSRHDAGSHLLDGPACLVDGALVLDRADVAGIAVECHGLEDAPHDLAAAG